MLSFVGVLFLKVVDTGLANGLLPELPGRILWEAAAVVPPTGTVCVVGLEKMLPPPDEPVEVAFVKRFVDGTKTPPDEVVEAVKRDGGEVVVATAKGEGLDWEEGLGDEKGFERMGEVNVAGCGCCEGDEEDVVGDGDGEGREGIGGIPKRPGKGEEVSVLGVEEEKEASLSFTCVCGVTLCCCCPPPKCPRCRCCSLEHLLCGCPWRPTKGVLVSSSPSSKHDVGLGGGKRPWDSWDRSSSKVPLLPLLFMFGAKKRRVPWRNRGRRRRGNNDRLQNWLR